MSLTAQATLPSGTAMAVFCGSRPLVDAKRYHEIFRRPIIGSQQERFRCLNRMLRLWGRFVQEKQDTVETRPSLFSSDFTVHLSNA